jgi:hypothetical protein
MATMSGADARDLEKRLLKMQEDIGPAPSDEQRADYIALWLDWCEAKGLPRTERTRRIAEKAGRLAV